MDRGRLKARVEEMRRTVGRRLYIGAAAERQVVDDFAGLYVESKVETLWMGEPTPTPPTDLWSYQEIVHATRPELVVARATPNAGYLSNLCRLAGEAEVVSWGHDEATDERLAAVAERARGKRSVMVVVGSGDRHAHLPAQLRRLGTLVTPGNYLIVEDTSPNGRRSEPRLDTRRDIEAFLSEDSAFVVDRTPEKFYLTFNSGGYLRRRR